MAGWQRVHPLDSADVWIGVFSAEAAGCGRLAPVSRRARHVDKPSVQRPHVAIEPHVDLLDNIILVGVDEAQPVGKADLGPGCRPRRD